MTVPGAPDASVEKINVKVGSAVGPKNNPKKDTYYGRLPTKCPKGFLPLKAELTFAPNAEEHLPGSNPETVTVEYKAPCPRK